MAKEGRSGENEVSLRIANELVEFANNKLEAGIDPVVIAAAFRHAAATSRRLLTTVPTTHSTLRA